MDSGMERRRRIPYFYPKYSRYNLIDTGNDIDEGTVRLLCKWHYFQMIIACSIGTSYVTRLSKIG